MIRGEGLRGESDFIIWVSVYIFISSEILLGQFVNGIWARGTSRMGSDEDSERKARARGKGAVFHQVSGREMRN